MWPCASRTSKIFLIDSWKAVLLAALERARARSTRLLVVDAFRIHMPFLLGGFSWRRISLPATIMSDILILIIFLLQRAVEDLAHDLVVLVVLVVAAKESTVDLLVVFCLHSSSAAYKYKFNTKVN